MIMRRQDIVSEDPETLGGATVFVISFGCV